MTARTFPEDEEELRRAVGSHCNLDVRQDGHVAAGSVKQLVLSFLLRLNIHGSLPKSAAKEHSP